jgi:hypothetical protein
MRLASLPKMPFMVVEFEEKVDLSVEVRLYQHSTGKMNCKERRYSIC